MILEITAIALTTTKLVSIICGSLAGGLAVGGTVSYVVVKKFDSSRSEIDQEYEMLDAETDFREKQRQHSLNSTYSRVSQISEDTLLNIAGNQERASTAIGELETNIDLAEKNNESGRIVIDTTMQESEVIKQLMAELKSKTEQIATITNDYESLKTQLSGAVTKLEEALTKLELINREIHHIGGEKDYAGQVIDVIKRMKSSNTEITKSLEIQTEKYEKAEQRIVTLTHYLQQAKTTIKAQEKIILGLREEAVEETQATGQTAQNNLRFF